MFVKRKEKKRNPEVAFREPCARKERKKTTRVAFRVLLVV